MLRRQLNEAQRKCRDLEQQHAAMKQERDQMKQRHDFMKPHHDQMKKQLDAALHWTGVSDVHRVLSLSHSLTEHPALLFILHANNGHSYPKLSFSSPFPLLTPSSITTFHVLHPSLAPPQRVCAAAEH